MTDVERGGVHILRATSSLVSFWVAVAVVVFLFGDAVLRGRWDVVARWLPLALLILWALWVVLWHSSVRFDRVQLVVMNALRTHTVPWSRVVDVRGGPQLRVDLDDGRTLTCTGGPFPARPGRRTGTVDDAVLLLDAARESAPRPGGPLVSTWDVPALAVGIILLGATLSSFAFVRG